MASLTSKSGSYLAFALLMLAIVNVVIGSDPDILTDFIASLNDVVNGSFFTYTGMRSPIAGGSQPVGFTATKASLAEFPALDGESVSYAFLQYPGGTVNPPHTHPRASELLVLIRGSLEVGFVDTTNKLFTQTLQEGDIFIFPKGLVHYQYNMDPNNLAVAVSAFGSASAGTVSVPIGVFTTGIDDRILAESFKTDVATIQKLKAGLAQPSRA